MSTSNDNPGFADHQIFVTKVIRDLHWALASPHVLSSSACAVVDDQWCAELVAKSLPWLRDLDADPTPVENWLRAQRNVRRLGFYFAALLEFWVRHCPLLALHSGSAGTDSADTDSAGTVSAGPGASAGTGTGPGLLLSVGRRARAGRRRWLTAERSFRDSSAFWTTFHNRVCGVKFLLLCRLFVKAAVRRPCSRRALRGGGRPSTPWGPAVFIIY